MSRDKSLIPLSRQHHHGLALCVVVERALEQDSTTGNIQAQSERLVSHYDAELKDHFWIEEAILFPRCPPQLRALIEELVSQHRQLERLFASLRNAPDEATLRHIANLLRDHIRKEEAELFEQVQHLLGRFELDELGQEIARRVPELK